MPKPLATLCFVFVTVATGCSVEETCGVEGETQACVCPSGAAGAQVCVASGAWAPCECERAGADALGDADAPAEVGVDLDALGDADAPAEVRVDLDALGDADAPAEVGVDLDALGDADAPAEVGWTACDSGDLTGDVGDPGELAVFVGSFSVRNADDLLEISRYTVVTGNLDFDDADGLSIVSLPRLAVVEGRFSVVSAGDLESFEAPRFQRAGTVRFAHNDVLPRVSMPLLARAEHVNLDSNPQLGEASFPALCSVGEGGVLVYGDSPFRILNLPALAEVSGDLRLFAEGLENLSLPSLARTTGDFHLAWNGLVSVNVPLLASVGGDFGLSNTRVEALVVPALEAIGGGLSVRSNEALATIDFPSLTEIRGEGAGSRPLGIEHNPQLPTCEAERLREQVGLSSGQAWIRGNDEEGTCE